MVRASDETTGAKRRMSGRGAAAARACREVRW